MLKVLFGCFLNIFKEMYTLIVVKAFQKLSKTVKNKTIYSIIFLDMNSSFLTFLEMIHFNLR